MLKIAMLSKWHVHAAGYAREFNQTGKSKVVAVWDEEETRGEKWAEELGVPFYASLDELLASDIDAVCVTTPTTMHREVILKAAKAGKCIFTEKALETTTEEALKLADAIRASGKTFGISFPHKCNPVYRYIKARIAEGAFGKISLFRYRNAHNGVSGNWLPEYWFDGSKAGGGAMMDLGAHPMYLSRWMLGKPVRIQSMFNARTGHAVEDNSVCTIEFENKAIAVAETGLVSGMNPSTMEVYGTKGVIICEDGKVRLRTRDIAKFVEGGWAEAAKLPEDQPLPLRQFIDSVLYGKPVSFGLKEGRELTELMENAYIADREKREVRF